MEKYGNAEIFIATEGKMWGLYKRGGGANGEYPCMRDIATGAIPKRSQRPLLRKFLLMNGIEPLEKWNTHKIIRKTIEFKLHDEISGSGQDEL